MDTLNATAVQPFNIDDTCRHHPSRESVPPYNNGRAAFSSQEFDSPYISVRAKLWDDVVHVLLAAPPGHKTPCFKTQLCSHCFFKVQHSRSTPDGVHIILASIGLSVLLLCLLSTTLHVSSELTKKHEAAGHYHPMLPQ